MSNRLSSEKSPYLLQHAENPVDWFAWDEQAFAKAKAEQKPIFLSIGYSTCHWCHVMEEESFVNPEIAKILNQSFISIKVDREERPDIDQIYMQAVMAMTGSGGWPMSVFLTPDGKPFYGGTYFPPEDRWGRPGFKTVLNTIAQKWQTEHESILRSGEAMAEMLNKQISREISGKELLNAGVLDKAYSQLTAQYDSRQGGFGAAPKFPRSHLLSFLLRYWKRTGAPEALSMAENTLHAMVCGGIHDHLGGGVHRYSTDAKWHVPHFEKMLYDQALLAKSYLEAYQASGREEFAVTARSVLDYVLRVMTAQEGGFFSAEDADSLAEDSRSGRKSEGAFYVWEEKEIRKLLQPEQADLFIFQYGVQPEGNAENDPQQEFQNKNILFLAHSADETAEKFSMPVEKAEKILAEARQILFKKRESRPRPHLDDKILTDWNGLMISTLAVGSRVLHEPRYLRAAEQAAEFILCHMRKDGRLFHRWRDGEAAVEGFLDDYIFLAYGLLDLYEASFRAKYLEVVKELLETALLLFWDTHGGGFFFRSREAVPLIAPSKEIYDGAVPSGNSAAVTVLVRAGRILANSSFEEKAGEIVKAFALKILDFPSGYPQMLSGLDFLLGPSREIVVAADQKEGELVDILFKPFLPNKVVLFHPVLDGEEKKGIETLAPYLKKQNLVRGKPAVYLCQNYACEFPFTDPEKLKTALER